MSVEDRVRWDQIYSTQQSTPYPNPDPFLLQYTPHIEPDAGVRALDLCGGMGQNGLWLAEQGYAVDIMDISRVGLNRARTEMANRNLRNVNLLTIDVEYLQLEALTYELVCVFRYLKRTMFPVLKRSIKPKGRIIYETYNRRYLDIVSGFNPDYLLSLGELRQTFSDWTILHDEEVNHITRLVAIKP